MALNGVKRSHSANKITTIIITRFNNLKGYVFEVDDVQWDES